jgi:hypothetical protein
MSTGMIVADHSHGGAMTVYDRVADPMAFIDQMGKVFAETGACGCKTHADGKLISLACLSERCSPFEIERRYHLMDGKLRKKADVMLAELRQAGGDFRWVKDGRDGEASIELTYRGQSYISTYTMADAERARLVKQNSGWEKNPANMLRARATSEGVRMIAPEIAKRARTSSIRMSQRAARRQNQPSDRPLTKRPGARSCSNRHRPPQRHRRQLLHRLQLLRRRLPRPRASLRRPARLRQSRRPLRLRRLPLSLSPLSLSSLSRLLLRAP